jgi:hypothetical protein
MVAHGQPSMTVPGGTIDRVMFAAAKARVLPASGQTGDAALR